MEALEIGDLIKCININMCTGLEIDEVREVKHLDKKGRPGFIFPSDVTDIVYYCRDRFIIVERIEDKLEKLGL